MKFKIITDASCDIPSDFVKENDISILPIEVRFKDEIFPEGLETNEFYQKIKETGIIPKTSKPNEYAFSEAYTPYVNKEGVYVITIVISSDLAGTIESAKHVTETMGMLNNYIFDGKCTTFMQGAMIMELCNYINEKERTLNEVIDKLHEIRDKIRIIAIIDDLKYLKASGRLSVTGYIAGSLLNIHPIITIEDGKVKNIGKKSGAKANQFLVDAVKNRDKNRPIYFGHSNYFNEIKNFVEKYEKELDVDAKNVEYHQMGCVIGSHVGPTCYGMVYFEK